MQSLLMLSDERWEMSFPSSFSSLTGSFLDCLITFRSIAFFLPSYSIKILLFILNFKMCKEMILKVKLLIGWRHWINEILIYNKLIELNALDLFFLKLKKLNSFFFISRFESQIFVLKCKVRSHCNLSIILIRAFNWYSNIRLFKVEFLAICI